MRISKSKKLGITKLWFVKGKECIAKEARVYDAVDGNDVIIATDNKGKIQMIEVVKKK